MAEKIEDINHLYQHAPTLEKQGERVVSTDEMTGVQALERQHPDLPLRPGQVTRQEFEDIRRGTCSLIVNFEVARGQVGQVSAGPTRTEEDFVRHIQRTVDAAPLVSQGHFVTDNLNTHQSESLVR